MDYEQCLQKTQGMTGFTRLSKVWRFKVGYNKTTDCMVDLLEEVLKDVPKAKKGNKTAAQRIRTRTVELTKLSKEWRKLSLQLEKKKIAPKKAR